MRTISTLVLTLALVSQATPASAYMVDRIPGLTGTTTFGSSSAPSAEQDADMSSGDDMTVPGTDKPLTRAQFTRMVVESQFPTYSLPYCYATLVREEKPAFELLYTDVSVKHEDAQYLCIAFITGIAKGYRDGSFRPDQPITFSEASAILSRAFVLQPYADAMLQDTWYMPHMEALGNRNAIPQTIKSFAHIVTDMEAREMLERLAKSITWRPSMGIEQVKKVKVLNRKKAEVTSAKE